MTTLLRELPSHIEAVCRDLSAGILRRDPWAKRVLGTTESARRRERRDRERALRQEAIKRLKTWQAALEPMYRLPVFQDGLSAQKANQMGRRVRTRSSDPKPRGESAYDPLRVSLPGWGREAA